MESETRKWQQGKGSVTERFGHQNGDFARPSLVRIHILPVGLLNDARDDATSRSGSTANGSTIQANGKGLRQMPLARFLAITSDELQATKRMKFSARKTVFSSDAVAAAGQQHDRTTSRACCHPSCLQVEIPF